MTQTCPSCSADAAGSRFCPDCGVAIKADCRGCGAPLAAGARFCNDCGHPVAGAAPSAPARPSPLPWIITGVAVVALAVVALLPRLGGGESAAAPVVGAPLTGPVAGPAAGGPAVAGDARAVDLSSMTPREAADRLFNRVMENVSRGDTAQARAFLPMAIGAYGRVETLDVDGRYHLASLHLIGGEAAAAAAQADSILAAEPNHLFGLFVRGQAAGQQGDAATARTAYRRFLAEFETETAKSRPEYRDHAQSLPAMRDEAQRAVAQ